MGVSSYHSQEYTNGKTIGKNRFNRYIGLELEVDRGYDEDFCRNAFVDENLEEFKNHFYFEHDGSLGNDGFECVSYPHSYKALMDFDWDKFTGILQENEFTGHDNDTCGLHIHFSKTWFKNHSHVNRILLLMSKFKDFFIDFSRRDEEKLAHWASICKIDSIFQAQNVYTDRYKAINKNTSTGKTYEFRIFKSSLNPVTIKASIDLCVALIKVTKDKDWEFESDLHGFRLVDLFIEEKVITKNLAEYLVVRGLATKEQLKDYLVVRGLATKEQLKDYLDTAEKKSVVVEVKNKITDLKEIKGFLAKNLNKKITYKLKKFDTLEQYWRLSKDIGHNIYFNEEMLESIETVGLIRKGTILAKTHVEFQLNGFITCPSWIEWIELIGVEHNDLY